MACVKICKDGTGANDQLSKIGTPRERWRGPGGAGHRARRTNRVFRNKPGGLMVVLASRASTSLFPTSRLALSRGVVREKLGRGDGETWKGATGRGHEATLGGMNRDFFPATRAGGAELVATPNPKPCSDSSVDYWASAKRSHPSCPSRLPPSMMGTFIAGADDRNGIPETNPKTADGLLDRGLPAISLLAPFPVIGIRMCGCPGEGDKSGNRGLKHR